jgi:hypothetical protein
MAYPTSRSCNAELYEGATDGAIQKLRPNRGGTDLSMPDGYPGHVLLGTVTNHSTYTSGDVHE